jgi:hypothetical protein
MVFDSLFLFLQVTELQIQDDVSPESLIPSNSDALFDIINEENVKSVQPGSTISYSISVQNNAPTTDTIDLNIVGTPAGWSSNLDDYSVTLAPSESQEVILEISPPSSCSITGDADMDGLSDLEEQIFATNVFQPDSDGDLIWDRAEIDFLEIYGLPLEDVNPYLGESDNDGDNLLDGEEAQEGTSPLEGDSDGDGLDDQDEVDLYYRESKMNVDEEFVTDTDSPILAQVQIGHATFVDELSMPNWHFIDFDHFGYYRIKFVVSTVVTTDRVGNRHFSSSHITDGESVDIHGELNDIALEATTIIFDGIEVPDENIVTNSVILKSYKSGSGSGALDIGLIGGTTVWEESRYYNAYVGSHVPSEHTVEFLINSPLPDGTIFDAYLRDIYVEKKGLDPNSPHSDEDLLEDGYEVKVGTFPLNHDSDDDNVDDYEEVMIHHTNPHCPDSDDDGVTDFNEINSQYYDVNRPGLVFKTDPNSADTDSDGLMDGEEDENKNGKNKQGPVWEGEPNPCDWDTDNDQMPDGWEVFYGLQPLQISDRIEDPDNDGLLNYQEYTIGTHPTNHDSDGDSLIDGINFNVYPMGPYVDPLLGSTIQFGSGHYGNPTSLGQGEILGIYFRTNVIKGAKYITDYGQSTSQYILLKDYIVFQGVGPWWEYVYDGLGPYENIDLSVNDEAYAKWDTNKLIITLYDLTKIYLNTTTNELYIWAPFSDEEDKDENQILEGYYYVFGPGSQNGAIPDLLLPDPGFKDQELYEGGNPLHNDTDGDRVLDSDEVMWDTSYPDSDGIVNIRDTDSDDDGISDSEERRGLSDIIYNDQYESDIAKPTYNPDIDGDNHPNMIDLDSDGDMVPDGIEPQWWGDTDNDGLDNMIDKDSDGDGLVDGFVDSVLSNGHWDPGEIGEDLNINGKVDPTETDPRKKDSDGDGLNDTEEIINVQTVYEAESNAVCFNPVQQVTSDPNASWEQAIINFTGKSDVGNLQLTLGSGEYRFYVRARLARGADSGIMRLQVANTDAPYSEFPDISPVYKWYYTEAFVLTASTDVTLKIFDKNDIIPSIFVDKIQLVKFPSRSDVTLFVGVASTKTLVFTSSPSEQTVHVDIPYPRYYAETATMDIQGDDQSGSYPSYSYLDVGDNGDKQWYHPMEFYDTDPSETTPDFAHEINRYIYTHEKQLNPHDGTIRIPLTFHSKTIGKLHLSNLRITFKSFFSDPSESDTDSDGLYDGDEVQAIEVDGILNFYSTNPGLEDTDGDLLLDNEEITGWDVYVEDLDEPDIIHVNSNPQLPDTDNDGIWDFEEIANSVCYSREAELIPHVCLGPRNSQILSVNSGSTSNPEHNGVAVGDVDNDGDKDIVVITGNTDIYLKLWNGIDWINDRMSNHMPVSYSIGAVFIGDADNDTKNEIVAASPQGDCVYIYKWTGSTWRESKVNVGNNPVSVYVGDADNDGDNEIVTANYNVKDGVSEAHLTVAATQAAWDSGTEDSFASALTDDEEPVAITDGTNENTISIVLWDDEKEKWTVTTVYVGNGPHSVFIHDADNDGSNEIITANFGGSDISLVKWDSVTKSWVYSTTVPVGSAPYAVFIADIDGDGDNDTITANHKPGVVIVRKWDSVTNNWADPEGPFTMSQGSRPYSLYVADADNDRYPDIIVTDSSRTNVNRAFWEKVEGQYQWTTNTYSSSYAPYSVFIGDADNDGYNDLLTVEDTGSDMNVWVLSMGQVVGDLEASNYKSIINKYDEYEIFDTTVDVVGETHLKYLVRAKLAPGESEGVLDIHVMQVDDSVNPDLPIITMTIDDLTNQYKWYMTSEFVVPSAISEIRLVAEDNSPNVLTTPGVYIDKIALMRVGDRATADKSSATHMLDGLNPKYDYVNIPVVGDLKRMAAETSSMSVVKEKSLISYVFDDVCLKEINPVLETEQYYKQYKEFVNLDYSGRNLESIRIYTGAINDVTASIEIDRIIPPSNPITFTTVINTDSQGWVVVPLPSSYTLSTQTKITIEYEDNIQNPVYPELYKNEVPVALGGGSKGYNDANGWEFIDEGALYYTWLIGLDIEADSTDMVPIITDDGVPLTPYIYSPYLGQIKIFDTSDCIGVEINSVSFYGRFVGVNPLIKVEIDEKEIYQLSNPGFGTEGWHTINLPSPIIKNKETSVAIKFSASSISVLEMFPANPIVSGGPCDSFSIDNSGIIQEISETWMMRLNMKVVTRVDFGDDGIYEWIYYGVDPASTNLNNLNHKTNKFLYMNEDDDSNGIISVPIKVTSNLAVAVTLGYFTTSLHPYSTNPFSPDTDKDFLYDSDELFFDGIDRDGIVNPSNWLTIPSDSDTEGDLVKDGDEIIGFTVDVRTSSGMVSSFCRSNPLSTDSDGDQLSDFVEYNRINSES